MAPTSRMQLARRRLRVARYAIAAITLGGFAGFGVLARDAHPATSGATASSAADATGTDDSASFFGGGAVIGPAPQAVAPSVQSAGS